MIKKYNTTTCFLQPNSHKCVVYAETIEQAQTIAEKLTFDTFGLNIRVSSQSVKEMP